MEHHRYIEYFQSQVIQTIPAESRPGTEVGQLIQAQPEQGQPSFEIRELRVTAIVSTIKLKAMKMIQVVRWARHKIKVPMISELESLARQRIKALVNRQ